MRRLFVILSILLFSVIFEVYGQGSANWVLLEDHPVNVLNDKGTKAKRMIGGRKKVRLLDIRLTVDYRISHQPNGSKAKSTVKSSVGMWANKSNCHGFAAVSGTADRGFTKGLAGQHKTDPGQLLRAIGKDLFPVGGAA